MESAATKTSRLLQLEQILLAHTEGVRPTDAARRLAVHRSTVYRYIDELSTQIPLYDTEDGRVAVDRDRYLNHIRLTVHEVLALHLATRHLANLSDRHNPHAAAAVRKIAQALESFSPRIAEVIHANADILDGSSLIRDSEFLHILEEVTRGWSESKRVRLRHHSIRRNSDDEYLVEVYHVQPYAAGKTIHVIGKCVGEDHLRTFRLDRIVGAEVTGESYEMPEDLDVEQLLNGAWGIWYGSGAIEVVLRFSAAVAHRVTETRWHESERVDHLADGSIRWRATVAEPREMYPWIRGWGADVEIIAPESLREDFIEELRRLNRIYGTTE